MQWYNAWETPVAGDTMSFGMTCIFLLFDGILYGVIGYLCSRKSQGGSLKLLRLLIIVVLVLIIIHHVFRIAHDV